MTKIIVKRYSCKLILPRDSTHQSKSQMQHYEETSVQTQKANYIQITFSRNISKYNLTQRELAIKVAGTWLRFREVLPGQGDLGRRNKKLVSYCSRNAVRVDKGQTLCQNSQCPEPSYYRLGFHCWNRLRKQTLTWPSPLTD